MRRRFILASASPARLKLLRSAGLHPEVMVSGVDEDDAGVVDVRAHVEALARHKAKAVAGRAEVAGSLVLGCDSMLELDGVGAGKPADAEDATRRWRSMRGRSATLFSGHHLLDTASGASASGVASTVVHFGSPTDGVIDAYVATGEPLAVAGAFTIDGRGGAFVEGVTGDPGAVIGVSLPLLRKLLADLGMEITELW